MYYGTSIGVEYVSPQEIQAGTFLQTTYGNGAGLTVFSNYSNGTPLSSFYLINAKNEGPPESYFIENKDALTSDMNVIVNEFKINPNSVFVYSESMATVLQGTFGISPDDPYWLQLKQELAGTNNQYVLFSNDYVHIYANPENSVKQK
jgi:hypothetical protein